MSSKPCGTSSLLNKGIYFSRLDDISSRMAMPNQQQSSMRDGKGVKLYPGSVDTGFVVLGMSLKDTDDSEIAVVRRVGTVSGLTCGSRGKKNSLLFPWICEWGPGEKGSQGFLHVILTGSQKDRVCFRRSQKDRILFHGE